MISINESKIFNMFDSFHLEIDRIISTSFKSMKQFRNTPDKSGGKGKLRIPLLLTAKEIEYLDYLISHFHSIVSATPSELKLFQEHFNRIIEGKEMSKNHKSFKNELNIRMGYDKYRDTNYPDFFLKTEIKTCVYCNSQLAVTVRSINGEKLAKFQVDHFLPKSEYPCFSISLFNLIPVCGPCNGKKSANAVNFNFYSTNYKDLKESPFKFYLDKKSVVKYRVNGNLDELIIKFSDPENRGFNKTFDIEGIYNTQKDLAEELVLKSIIYNQKYLQSLQLSFKKLYPNKMPMVERLIIGNYSNERDIHKRPMSKFTMDIARDLNLIK